MKAHERRVAVGHVAREYRARAGVIARPLGPASRDLQACLCDLLRVMTRWESSRRVRFDDEAGAGPVGAWGRVG